MHTISAPSSFSVKSAFDVLLTNAGQAVHVHLHLDDELSRVAHLDASNRYVEGDNSNRVHVDVSPAGEPVTGTLKIVTGYGAETAYVDVTVEPTTETRSKIEVDERLSRPPKREPERSLVDELRAALPSENALPVVALLLLVLAVAGVVVSVVQNTVVVLSVGVVLGAAVAGAVLLLRK